MLVACPFGCGCWCVDWSSDPLLQDLFSVGVGSIVR
jgi:hypothetical protein